MFDTICRYNFEKIKVAKISSNKRHPFFFANCTTSAARSARDPGSSSCCTKGRWTKDAVTAVYARVANLSGSAGAALPLLRLDRFQRDKSDPSVIVFSEIKRCQLPQFTQFFQKAIFQAGALDTFGFRSSCLVPHRRRASLRSACMLKKIRGF